jgi:hypothetical protein
MEKLYKVVLKSTAHVSHITRCTAETPEEAEALAREVAGYEEWTYEKLVPNKIKAKVIEIDG